MNNSVHQRDIETKGIVIEAGTTEQAHELAVREAISQMLLRLDDSTLSSIQLAKVTSYSPFHFERIFRSVTGIPPRLFLSALRFQWSKKLLLKSSATATEVGQTVGFSSFGTFSSNFSRFIGLSPQQFRAFIEDKMLGLLELQKMQLPLRNSGRSSINGYIDAPIPFDGIICVGLFPKPIPMGKPIGCTIRFGSGAYSIGDVPDGDYYVMSIAFAWDDPIDEFLYPQHALRGKATGKVKVKAGEIRGDCNVILRHPKFYDPPILVSLPLLIQAFIDKLAK